MRTVRATALALLSEVQRRRAVGRVDDAAGQDRTGYWPVNAARLTILRCRLIRVREMSAPGWPAATSARHGSPGHQPSPRGRPRSLPRHPWTVTLIAETMLAAGAYRPGCDRQAHARLPTADNGKVDPARLMGRPAATPANTEPAARTAFLHTYNHHRCHTAVASHPSAAWTLRVIHTWAPATTSEYTLLNRWFAVMAVI